MMDFMCMGCGHEVSADPKDFNYEQDGDTVTSFYQVTCPRCGRVHKCREIFRWDGVVIME